MNHNLNQSLSNAVENIQGKLAEKACSKLTIKKTGLHRKIYKKQGLI